MTHTLFFVRIFGLASIASVIALLGGVSASIYGAGLVAFVGAILYTTISERLLRRKLLGKIGGSPISWYTVHLVNETVVAALLTWGAMALFGWTAGGLVAILGGVAGWILLTWDTLGSLLPLIAMLLAVRR